jgi:oligopeptide transport system permease protein
MKQVMRRGFMVLLLVFLLSTAAFALLRVVPGGPYDLHRVPARPGVERVLQERYRANDPLWKQYLRYVGLLWEWYPHDGWVHAQRGLMQGALGPSFSYSEVEVREVLDQALRVSLLLGVLGFAFAVGLGIPWGIGTGVGLRGLIDVAGSYFFFLVVWVPLFIAGPTLALRFVVEQGGFSTALQPGSWVLVLLPPALLGLFLAARIAGFLRNELRKIVQSPFLLTARAKGRSESGVLWRHAIPTALLGMYGGFGPMLASLLTGLLVMETVFRMPGVGWVLVESARSRDLPMTVHLLLLYTLVILLLHVTVSVSRRLMDPRLRHA